MFGTLIAGAVTFVTTMIAGAEAAVVDLSSVDFSPIVAAINGAIPAVLTAIIPITGTRKVISFVMGAVKGA